MVLWIAIRYLLFENHAFNGILKVIGKQINFIDFAEEII